MPNLSSDLTQISGTVLIGRMVSPYVRRTAVLLDLLGMPFVQVPVAAIAQQDELRTINPIGRVPALRLDGRLLFDSLAIALTLTDLHDPEGRLLPREGWDRADALQFVTLVNGATERAVGSYYERARRPEDKVWQDWAGLCEAQALSAVDALEAEIAGRALSFTLTYPMVALVTSLTFLANAVPGVFSPSRHPALAALHAAGEASEALRLRSQDSSA